MITLAGEKAMNPSPAEKDGRLRLVFGCVDSQQAPYNENKVIFPEKKWPKGFDRGVLKELVFVEFTDAKLKKKGSP